jgi:hypothetical protein
MQSFLVSWQKTEFFSFLFIHYLQYNNNKKIFCPNNNKKTTTTTLSVLYFIYVSFKKIQKRLKLL